MVSNDNGRHIQNHVLEILNRVVVLTSDYKSDTF